VAPHLPLPDTPFFGSPTKIFEYMALGRPIVASRLEQIGELLVDATTARLVTPGSADDLAAGITSVLGQPDGGRSLGRQAREEALCHHTWDERARLILDHLGVAAASPPAARRNAVCGSATAPPPSLRGVV
jgi:glycosyltransferase involved in cell wall biosynthesis